MDIMYKIKPLLQTAEEMKKMERMLEEAEQTKKDLEIERKKRKDLEEQVVMLTQSKNDLVIQLNAETAANEDAEDRCDALIKTKVRRMEKYKQNWFNKCNELLLWLKIKLKIENLDKNWDLKNLKLIIKAL